MISRARLLGAAAAILLAAVPARAALLNPVVVNTSTGSVNVSWTAGASPYIAVLSTSSSYANYISSGPVASNAAAYPGLDPDTTYYFKVKSAADADGQYTGASTDTWAAAPTGMYFNSAYFTAPSSFTATINAAWAINGNPEWTRYEVTYDVVPGFTSAVTVPKTSPQGNPAVISGLSANTTYYLKVRARGVNGMLTAETSYISTATLAINLPGISDGVFETSATVSWTPVDDSVDIPLKSEGYKLVISLSELLTPPVIAWSSPLSSDSSTSLTPLLRNTTYFYSVNTVNWNDVSDLTSKRTFTTLAARPQNLALAAVSSTTARLNWTALPSSPQDVSALGYRLEGSSVNFNGSDTPLYTANQTVAISTLTLNGLDENTTYYLRTASVNISGKRNYTAALSTITLTSPPSANLTTIVPETDALTVFIFPLPGTLQRNSCEGYKLIASSTNFNGTGVVLSSSTPDPKDFALALTGLRPNTPYNLRLATLNWDGAPNFSDLPPTSTLLPPPPSGVDLGPVWQSSGTVYFAGIPGGDSYTLEASTHEFFDSIQRSSFTFDAGVTTLTVTGLDLNTRYYFRMAALYNGTTVYTTASPSNKSTLPASLGSAVFTGVFYSSVTVAWTPLPASPPIATAESYRLEAAVTPDFAQVLFSSSTLTPSVDHLTLTGLAPNTSYYFRAGSVNWDNAASYSFTPATATLANAPTQNNFTITPFTITPVWLANSNPPDTVYIAELADDSGFTAGLVSSATVLSSATFSGLIPNTTYYTRVTAVNRLNRAAPTVTFSPMATGAFYPNYAAYLPSDIGVSSITSRWGSGIPIANPAGTAYLAEISSSTDLSGNLTGVISSSITVNLYASFPGLASNTSYYMRVSALNLTGVPTDPPVDLLTALTLPATPYILPLEQTFTNALTDGFTVNWLDNNNSSVTVYNVRVSTAENFSVIASSLSVKGLSCDFKNLQIGTSYWAQVQTMSQSGILSEYVTAGSSVTLSTAVLNAVALQDSIVTLKTSYGDISVHLPHGSIGSSTILTLRALTPSTATFSAPISAVSQLAPTGIGLTITHFPPTIVFGAITITLPYRISDLPSGTDRAKLILALFDEQNAVWIPLPSVSETANNRVIGQTWHLSTFQIMQAQSETGLSKVKIYPNPYRPNSVSDVMHFTNMPPYTKVKFYTFLGELVREIKADVNGMAHWDGLNNDGRKVASGVYIAFIQTKDKKSSKSFKIALER